MEILKLPTSKEQREKKKKFDQGITECPRAMHSGGEVDSAAHR